VPDRIIVPSPSYSVMNYLSPNLIEMLRINQGKDGWEIMPEAAAATKRQIDGLASLYEEHGVKVHRPRPWTEVEEEYLASIQSGGWPLYMRDPVPLTHQWLHLDCVFAIVRRGLAIADLTAFRNGLPDPVKDWKIIPATSEEAHSLGCNTVCLEENVVLIGAEHKRLIKELKNERAEVVSTPMDAASMWGGGIRCATHPLRREI